ncbi:hypothetical protein [Candidatus Nitrososphaera sp. FF02]|uniref:hypothetical protein n=1 Tax=Candidatus Nitrososphaera sp. FF02 TaxID=3398226 RepID=UPI0039E7E2EB
MVASEGHAHGRCSMCGQSMNAAAVKETVDGVHLCFHSQTCASTFKKLLGVYGKDFLAESQEP